MEKQSTKRSNQDIKGVAKESLTSKEEKPTAYLDEKIIGAIAEIETEAVSIARYCMYFAQITRCVIKSLPLWRAVE